MVSSKSFTLRERNIIIFCLKRRLASLKEVDNDFLNNSKSWKNTYYYPVLYAKLKMEDNTGKLLTKSEKISIESCVNEEKINENNKEELTDIIRKIEK